jgi:DNA-binding transcriptional ArsR family regulator
VTRPQCVSSVWMLLVLLALTTPRLQLTFNHMVEYSQAPELDRVFAALADPTRRAILQTLSQRPATINEIAKPFAVSLNAISKHVIVLERAGLVRREIKGREHHCSIDPRPLGEANAWLEHYRQFWERRLDALQIYVARKFKAAKKGTSHGKLH